MSWKINESRRNNRGEGRFCSHQFSEADERQSCVRFLTEWECDYCGKIINWGGNHPKPNQMMTRPVLNSLTEKHLKECEKAQEFISTIDAKKDNNLNYDDEKSLKEKGYWGADEIRNWWLEGRVILPNLKEEKRVGMVKQLTVYSSNQNHDEKFDSGNVIENLIFLTPRSTPINYQNFSELFEKDQKPDPLYFPYGGSKKTNLYKKIVASFFVWKVLQKEKGWNYNIFTTIINLYKFMPISGESGTLSLYLALLSAYYQKPISQEVAATGFLDIGNYSYLNCCPWCFQEKIKENPIGSFFKHKVSRVGGLEYKIPAAVKAGVKKLILSVEQKDDYEKNIPQEIKEKLTVYYVKDVEELEKLFWQGEFS